MVLIRTERCGLYVFTSLLNKVSRMEFVPLVGWLVAEHPSNMLVSLGRICSDKFTCCHTEIKVADQTF